MGDHHNYSLDKDTPESIREMLDQESDLPTQSQHGLPAGDRINNQAEPQDQNPEDAEGFDPFEAARTIPVYGIGADKAGPNEFHGK